jgi:hypothetical protein
MSRRLRIEAIVTLLAGGIIGLLVVYLPFEFFTDLFGDEAWPLAVLVTLLLVVFTASAYGCWEMARRDKEYMQALVNRRVKAPLLSNHTCGRYAGKGHSFILVVVLGQIRLLARLAILIPLHVSAAGRIEFVDAA